MTQMPMLQLPPSPERTWRILTIAADLLPVEVVETRRARKVRRSVVVGIIALVLALAGWYAYAVYQTSKAQAALDSAQADTQRLQSRQATFAPLVRTQTEATAIHAQIAGLLGNDLRWSSVVNPAIALAPSRVAITAVNAVLTQPKTGLPNTSGHTIIGQLTLSGRAPDTTTIAQYVDTVAGVKGLANPYVTSAVGDQGQFTFTVRYDITDQVLGGRFTNAKK